MIFAFDTSLNRVSGALEGAPTYTASGSSILGSGFKRSVSFNGTSDDVNLGTGLNINAGGTIELAFRRGRTGVVEGLVAKWGTTAPYILYLDASDKVNFAWTTSGGAFASIISTATIADTTTAHRVAVTFDGTNVRLYVDGALQATSASTSIKSGSQTVYVARTDVTSQNFQGSIDELRFSSTARYTAGSYTVATAPFAADASTLALYHFDDEAFVESGSNPILTLGGAGSGYETDVANPDYSGVDPADGNHVLTFSGYSSTSGKWSSFVATATAIDGPYTVNTTAILAPDVTDGYIAANGSLVFKGGTYYLFYHRQSSNGTTIPPRICLATASSRGGPYTRQGVVIDVGTAGANDDTGTFDPCVRLMVDGVTFEALYCGSNSSGTRVIMRATSTNGTTFTKSSWAMSAPSGLTSNFGEPGFYLRDDGQLVVFCDGGTNRSIQEAFVDRTAGQVGPWVASRLAASGGGWESVQVFDSFPARSAGKVYLFHAGAPVTGAAQGLGAQIGVATVTDDEYVSVSGLLLKRRRFLLGAA